MDTVCEAQRQVRVEKWLWRQRYLSMPGDAEKEPGRYVSLVKEVASLLTRKQISTKWADIILDRRNPDAHELACLIELFEVAGTTLWSDLALGLTGNDYTLAHAEAIVQALKTTEWNWNDDEW